LNYLLSRYFTFILKTDIVDLSVFQIIFMRQPILIPGQAGQILLSRRKALKLSQQEVAAKLGIAQSRLSALEDDPGRLSLERLIALANILGLEVTLQDKPASPAATGAG